MNKNKQHSDLKMRCIKSHTTNSQTEVALKNNKKLTIMTVKEEIN